MSMPFLFWLLMLLWLVFGLFLIRVPGQPYPWERGGNHVLIFILLSIIGYKVFGSPIHP